MTPFSYHSLNLSLIAKKKKKKNMPLLVNHLFIPIVMLSKSISLEQICYKKSQGIVVNPLHCLLFSTSKKRPKTNLEKCYQCSVTLKFLWTSKFVF